MDLTRWAIENNRTTLVALFVLALSGTMAFFSSPRDKDPGFIVRNAVVMTYFPGASPERVEQLVTDRIEKKVQEMPEVKVIRSTSKTGVSIIQVEFKAEHTVMQPIFDDLTGRAEETDLPDGVIGPVVLDDLGDVYGIVITMTGDGFTPAELNEYAENIRDEILYVPDVASVNLYGDVEERIFVEYSNTQLSQFGLSPSQLYNILSTRNIVSPGGDLRSDRETIVFEPTGNFESVQELRRTVIAVPGTNQTVYLEDLAKIHRGYEDPPAQLVRADGRSAVSFAVSMRKGGIMTTMGERVRDKLATIQGQLPIGLELQTQYFLPEDVDTTVKDFTENLLQSILIVMAVMLLSLGLRTGLVVASLIPMAIVMAFVFMGFFDIGIDQVSLAALIIALGLLVDNAIVVSESILVLMEKGMSALDAAVQSAKELRLSLMTASLTTAAAFLPIYLAESAVGEYTSSIFKVVTITLLCSWLLAMTMTPLLAVMFLRVKKKSGADEVDPDADPAGLFYRAYRGFLTILLRFKFVTLILVIAAFMGTMSLASRVPQLFFPPTELAFVTAKLELPEGSPIEWTEQAVQELEQFVANEVNKDEEIVTEFGSFIGGGEPVFQLGYQAARSAPNNSITMLTLSDSSHIDDLIVKIESHMGQVFPDMKTTVARLGNGPPVSNPVEIRLSGRDFGKLSQIAEATKLQLETVNGTRNIGDNWGRQTKKVVVDVDQERARQSALTSQDIAFSLQMALSGIATTDYREGNDVIPVMLRSQAADRQDVGKLDGLNVYSQTTQRPVPLKQVAELELEFQPAKILRRNRLRTIMVTSELQPGVTAAEINAAMRPWMEEQAQTWGLGYAWEFGGEAEKSGEANASIGVKLPIAGLLILLLLVFQFNSTRRAAIVLATIPLGLIGVIGGLLITKSYFGFMTLLGIISLAGIVINNAIVLIERIELEIKVNGETPQRAIVKAAQLRARPILLTTATTVGGLLPLWLSGGAMWEPMAISIIFGLLVSTLLTLGVVPVLYAILFRVSYRRASA